MPLNPFTLLGLPHSFDLSTTEIETAYLRRVAAAHPDSGVDATADDASDNIAPLNNARDTLLNPESRANALLHTLGGPSSSQCDELPKSFLAEILHQRMQIEEDLQADPTTARPKWSAWAEEERSRIIQGLRPLFQAATPATPEIRLQIRTGLNAWRYIERLIEQLRPDYDPGRNDFPQPKP